MCSRIPRALVHPHISLVQQLMPSESDASDADLISRVRNGDIAAFEVLFRTWHGALCDTAFRYVQSQAVAEELVQDLFLALWLKRTQWNIVGSLRAYLLTAARNRALHFLRREGLAMRWATSGAAGDEDAMTVGIAAAGDEDADDIDARIALREAVASLPDRCRHALTLCCYGEMSHAAAAAEMGISVKGVEKLLASAMRKLRAALGPPRQEGPPPGTEVASPR